MELDVIIGGVQCLLIFGLGFSVLFLRQNVKVQDGIKGLINEAEDMYADVTKSGGQKFEWVVNAIYDKVPAFLKPIISKEFIGKLVQRAFDEMQAFALKQLNKVVDRGAVNADRV